MRRNTPRWLSALLAPALALAVSLASADARATTVVPITVEQLAQRADVVVVATVRSTRALWEGQLIVTDCELEVRVAMKGALQQGATLTLRVPGGVLGDVGQTIPGVARLDRGDTVVAFVTRAEDRAPNRYYLTHLTASILPITVNSATSTPSGTLVVRPAAEGMTVAPTPGQGPTNSTGRAPAASNAAASRTVMTRAGVTLERLATLVRGGR